MQNHNNNIISHRIHITGLVQGVGFRPFVYRMAVKHHIHGSVENRNDGVHILAEGTGHHLENFLQSLHLEAPPASEITGMEVHDAETQNLEGFHIVKSSNSSEEITRVSPDIATCEECIMDMKRQDHRINYPFINCTNCGPRFTIIQDLPYDRGMTTMAPFEMCPQCRAEYENIRDRRFHAQPVACKHCGPTYSMIDDGHKITNLYEILHVFAQKIREGSIVAIKGMGGFHLACDARKENAVRILRECKQRDGKPFAVMFRDLTALEEYVHVNEAERRIITSWRRPIVILKTKKELAPDVSVGFPTVGAMLPYMPMHHLIFESIHAPALVMTSGNISDEPIVIDNELARQHLKDITRNFITYNREIHNRTDDSVAMIVNGRERLLRRSRGYVPDPVETNLNVDGIMGAGAELVNCFCLGKGKQAILSQHIGDLKNIETLEFYEESVELFKRLFRTNLQIVACDLHPDYLSTKWAEQQGLEIVKVQHHHAHIASCMAEHGLDEKVIGIAMDGVGLGDDENIWGGEFFVCDYENYQRIYHLDYVPQPGGDAATRYPWQMAVSYLYHYFGNSFRDKNLPFLETIDDIKVNLVLRAIDKKLNCPLTSSTGRLFDAVSALTNTCTESTFHAEAPMRMESKIMEKVEESYEFDLPEDYISLKSIFKGITEDILSGTGKDVIAAKFHNTVINIILAASLKIRGEQRINKVVLSGGTFQNRYLLENAETKLKEEGFDVYTHERVPSNDGGIALGQLMIAAKRRTICA